MADTQAGKFPVHTYVARPSNDHAFVVTHNSFPTNVDLTDVERIFDQIVNQTINSGSQLISKEDITLHGIPGREIVSGKEGQAVSLRFYLLDREIYQIYCIMPKESVSQKTVRGFLESFQLK